MPADVGVIDLMLDIPTPDMAEWYRFLEPQLREESRDYEFPAQYMFKDVPHVDGGPDPVATVLTMMDHHGIDKAMIGVSVDGDADSVKRRALRDHPDRFIGSVHADPNAGVAGLQDLVRAQETLGVKAVTAFPAGYLPQVPIDDKRFFPVYAKCIELGLPIFVCTGICGPRVPSACQDTALIDNVCSHFPELVFVMRHGAEPWTKLAVKLLLKWPNLYYSTSAFAPRYYPKAIVDFANTRGADKVMYAGYFPMGLGLDVIFEQLPQVPFRDEVWPKFLRTNAEKVLGL
ncbi:MAG: amidohydrolase [Acidimicrobiales bacterium]|nr:amidohydrolase [Acidimicrobiales bacterium]